MYLHSYLQQFIWYSLICHFLWHHYDIIVSIIQRHVIIYEHIVHLLSFWPVGQRIGHLLVLREWKPFPSPPPSLYARCDGHAYQYSWPRQSLWRSLLREYQDLWLWGGEGRSCDRSRDWSCDFSPATSVATRMGNSFFLNVVMTLSLSPWDISPWRRPTRERERERERERI